MQILWGIGGMVALLAIAFLLSTNRRAIKIAILLGGVGGMAPSRRSQIAQFGIRALIAGTLANLLNAAIAGMLIG